MRSDEDRGELRALTLAIIAFIIVALLNGCVLFRPWAPQPSAPTRECVGTFVYPDSAGHCVPKETTR